MAIEGAGEEEREEKGKETKKRERKRYREKVEERKKKEGEKEKKYQELTMMCRNCNCVPLVWMQNAKAAMENCTAFPQKKKKKKA